jgi:hypothetical protein
VKLLEREFSVFKQKEKNKEVDATQRVSETERA